MRQSTELITFIYPADWTMFQVPNGLDFTSLKNNRGEAIMSTIEKLEIMKEFREREFLELLNKQYPDMQLNEPKKVKLNSVVLIRNIANEPKREPLKLARIVKIHDSRDETQRVVTLTYNNVKQNKDGKWIGTPMTVDRSIVDDASNESMLNSNILRDNTDTEGNEPKETGAGTKETGTGNDETGTGIDETGTGNDETGTGNDETCTGNDETDTGND